MTTRTLTTEVTIGQIKAALLFAAKEDVRGYLNGVCIDHTSNGTRLVATDGHRAIFVCLDNEPFAGEPTRYVVERVILETVAKLNKAGSVAFVWEQDSNPDPTREGVTVVSVPRVHVHGIPTADLQAAYGKFPEYEKLVPKKCSGKVSQFNATYIMDCAKARKALGSKFPDCVTIAYNGDSGALVTIAEGAFAIVMPMRGDPEVTPPVWFTGEVAKKAAAEAA